MSIATLSFDLSTKNENNLITGEALGRPPTIPANAGAIPVDAWAIWEPYLGTAELQGHTKTLIDGRSFPTT